MNIDDSVDNGQINAMKTNAFVYDTAPNPTPNMSSIGKWMNIFRLF